MENVYANYHRPASPKRPPRPIHQQQPIIITQDLDGIAQEQVYHQAEYVMSHIPHSQQRQLLPWEELADDEVFIFDDM